MQITAIALANNFALASHNTRDFKCISNLLVEDWE
jgi:predicted nucleic acid-binding protein